MFNRAKFNHTRFNIKNIPSPSVIINAGITPNIDARVIYKVSSEIDIFGTLVVNFRTIDLYSSSFALVTAKTIVKGVVNDIYSVSALVNPLYTARIYETSSMNSNAGMIRFIVPDDINGITNAISKMARLVGSNFELNTIGGLILGGNEIRQRNDDGLSIQALSSINIAAVYIISEVLTLNGISFNPGDEIVVDTKNYTITLNGQNILNNLDDTSEFFNLAKGLNRINYRDTAASRNIMATVVHQDTFL